MPNCTLDMILKASMSLQAFLRKWKENISRPLRGLDRNTRRYLHYARYNWERYHRVLERYRPSSAFLSRLDTIQSPETWVAITEDWCADAAYSLPVLVRAAEHNPHITLRIVERDTHPEIMDCYLTNGARAIPKVIAFDEQGHELFQWGSKPEALARLRTKWKAEGIEGSQLSQATIDWYEAEGWREVERELTALLNVRQEQLER